jgi:tetratricopeptide (TPR) repeat protein
MGDTARAREAFTTYVKLERRPEKQRFVKQARGELDALAGKITPVAEGGAVTADSENERGARLFQDKKTDDAIPAFERAVQLDPKHKVAWYNLAHARRKAGRHTEAVLAYRAFIALDPENPDPYYGLGHSLRAVGDAAGARAAFERYVALEKRESETKFVARAREALSEIEKAGEPASQPASQPVVARPAAPAKPVPSLTASPAEIEARYKKGVALEKKGDRAGAIKAWELTLLFSPEHARARRSIEVAREREGRKAPPDRDQILERARALTADGRGATAIALLDPAFDRAGAGGDVDLLAARAQARLGSGDTPGAISDWNLVLSLDPRRGDAWLGLGDAYAAAGDKPRARWFYEGFLARAGSDPDAAEVRKRLEAP